MEPDHFWYSSAGWHYVRNGVQVGPFTLFEQAAEDYFEPDHLSRSFQSAWKCLSDPNNDP